MSPWMFNLFIYGVMREVREKVDAVRETMWDARRNCEYLPTFLPFRVYSPALQRDVSLSGGPILNVDTVILFLYFVHFVFVVVP